MFSTQKNDTKASCKGTEQVLTKFNHCLQSLPCSHLISLTIFQINLEMQSSCTLILFLREFSALLYSVYFVCRCHISIQFWHVVTILLLYLSLSWHLFRLAKQSCIILFNSRIFKCSSWLFKKTHSVSMWTQKESLCVSQDKLKTFGKLQRCFTSSDIIKYLKRFIRISNWMKVRDLVLQENVFINVESVHSYLVSL